VACPAVEADGVGTRTVVGRASVSLVALTASHTRCEPTP
jgi:hypothetical protein